MRASPARRSTQPVRVATLDDNLRLALGSSCIDTGDQSLRPEEKCAEGDYPPGTLLLIDLDWTDRVKGPEMDIGAYEGMAVDGDCYADCNDDGELNILDFVCFQALFAAGDLEADCNGDGVLNVLDFVCFQAEFAAGC